MHPDAISDFPYCWHDLNSSHNVKVTFARTMSVNLDWDGTTETWTWHNDRGWCLEEKTDDFELFDADPTCTHDIQTLDSGVKCKKCRGWFCL